MWTSVLLVLCLILLLGYLLVKYDNINIIKLLILDIQLFICEYIIISGVLFLFEIFEINTSLLLCNVVSLIVFTIKIFKTGIKNINLKVVDFDIKDYLGLIVIILLALPFTYNKFELHGMGQDEGVYQIKAIALLEGISKKQIDFEEYHELSTEEEKSAYFNFTTKGFRGLDNYDYEVPTLEKKNELSAVSAIFHGIPTFPALLALWGRIFGMREIVGIQTIAFVCVICLIWFICENLKINKAGRIVASSLAAFSPLVIWVSKSSLTEMFLAAIICGYIYYMTDEEKNNAILFSSLYIITFSFFHITAFTMMPLFVLVYIVMYGYTNNLKYIVSGIISLVGFELGLIIDIHISPMYSLNNLTNPLKTIFKFININNVFVISIICVLISLAALILLFFLRNKFRLFTIKYKNKIKFISQIIIILLMIKVIYNYITLWKDNSFRYSIQRASFSAYMFGGGILVFIISVSLIVFKMKELCTNKNRCLILILFGYTVIFYSAYLKIDIPYYYYFSRYLTPYIPVVTIMGGLSYSVVRKNQVLLKCIAVLSILLYIPYNIVLCKEKDDTRMEWKVLEDLTKQISENDIVFIDDGKTVIRNIIQTLALPIKFITGAKIYPTNIDMQARIDSVQPDSDIYILTETNTDETGLQCVYKNYVYTSDDYQESHGYVIPYAKSFSQNSYMLNMYKSKYSLIYNFEKDYVNIEKEGFDSLEKTFAWNNSETSYINIFLSEKKDYTMHIKLGPGSGEDILLDIGINENYLTTVVIAKDKGWSDIEIHIPKEYVEIGKNKVQFSNNLWSPSDHGIADGRRLGFSLSELRFEEYSRKLSYNLVNDYSSIVKYGFNRPEDTFVWSSEEKSCINVNLKKEEYLMTLNLGPGSSEEIALTVLVNNNIAGNIIIPQGKGNYALQIPISKEYTKTGSNEICFLSNLWSPKNHGRDDGRYLGFALKSISFLEVLTE